MPSQPAPPKTESREVPPSVVILVAANLVPLYGVLFLGWQVFPLMALFWAENVIIGAFTVLKMTMGLTNPRAGCIAKPFLIGFFIVHYGGFASGHAVFVLTLFGGFWERGLDIDSVGQTIGALDVGWALLALALSHAASFVLNYVGKGEYRTADVGTLMLQPYGRVVVLHVTLLLGGFIAVVSDARAPGLALLVVLKIIVDLRGHLREHAAFDTQEAPVPAAPAGGC